MYAAFTAVLALIALAASQFGGATAGVQRPATVRVAVPAVSAHYDSEVVFYQVRPGDTPGSIAERFGSSPEVLYALNGAMALDPTPGAIFEVAGSLPESVPCGDLLVPIGKVRHLPAPCEPPELAALSSAISLTSGLQLIPQAADALGAMLDAARDDGVAIVVSSAYRSAATQDGLYAYWVRQLGRAQADRVSARSGHSEHQLGTTVDLTSAEVGYGLTDRFAGSAAGRWLQDHAAVYGFASSYPADGESVTGYAFEPWHLRYVGVEVAAGAAASELPLEPYLLRLWLHRR